jgi:hypothetical protein
MLKLERYFKSGVGLIAIQQFAEEKTGAGVEQLESGTVPRFDSGAANELAEQLSKL